jgi:hypothetical protein
MGYGISEDQHRKKEKTMSNEQETHSDTDPPPPEPEHHGFLEGYRLLATETFEILESVVKRGVTPTERLVMIKVSLKLLTLAMHDAKEEDFSEEMKSEVVTLLEELTALHFS